MLGYLLSFVLSIVFFFYSADDTVREVKQQLDEGLYFVELDNGEEVVLHEDDIPPHLVMKYCAAVRCAQQRNKGVDRTDRTGSDEEGDQGADEVDEVDEDDEDDDEE